MAKITEKEYIEREAVLDYIDKRKRKMFADSDGKHRLSIEVVEDVIKDFPAADVAPVVHCKNCEYNNECSVQDFGEMHQNDFCSRGKRRSDNGKVR